MVEKKKANEVAMQVALTLATGGAGAAVGTKLAEEAVKKKLAEEVVKKKLAEDAARNSIEKKIRMEAENQVKKKATGDGRKTAGGGKTQGALEKAKRMQQTSKKNASAGLPPEDDPTCELFKKSQNRVDAEIVKNSKKRFGEARADKTNELKDALDLSEPGERQRYEDGVGKLANTKIYVVKQKVWDQHILDIARKSGWASNNASQVHGFMDARTNEIYVCERRASDSLGAEKTIRHEVDHVVCKHDMRVLREGHADHIAITEGKLPEELVSYPNCVRAYNMLSDLAGESGAKHAAYAGGNEELKQTIVERYQDKVDAAEIRERFDSIAYEKRSDYAVSRAEALYKRLEPKKFELMEADWHGR